MSHANELKAWHRCRCDMCAAPTEKCRCVCLRCNDALTCVYLVSNSFCNMNFDEHLILMLCICTHACQCGCERACVCTRDILMAGDNNDTPIKNILFCGLKIYLKYIFVKHNSLYSLGKFEVLVTAQLCQSSCPSSSTTLHKQPRKWRTGPPRSVSNNVCNVFTSLADAGTIDVGGVVWEWL